MNMFSGNQLSQAEKELKPLLMDDGCHVLSTFELNKMASLTYGDLVCDEIFELIEKVVSMPLEYTPLTIQKTLVALKHVLIYGSEKCVNSGYGIGNFVSNLQNFNTILAAQQKQGAMAFFQRLQGGGVDRGGPVREAAKAVVELLSNIDELQRIRNSSASKDSLVPIGDDKVAFVTDEVRLYLLKKKMQEQQRIDIKSNLAKSEGGFGGGYNAQDGKTVVGAAHGIEAMIKMASREKKRFTDDGPAGPNAEDKLLEELAAQDRAEKAEAAKVRAAAAASHNTNLLLGAFNPAPAKPAQNVDLLDFGGGGVQTLAPAATVPTATNLTGDLLGGHGFTAATPTPGYSNDLLGLDYNTQGSTSTGLGGSGGGLLDMTFGSTAPMVGIASVLHSVDPFAPVSVMPAANTPILSITATPSPVPSNGDSFGLVGVTSMMNTMGVANNDSIHKLPAMGSNEDRFSALDALATISQLKVPVLDAKLAENRLLDFGSTSSSSASILGNGPASLSLSTPLEPFHQPPPVPMGMSLPPPDPNMAIPGAGQVAKNYGDDEDDDNPWVMGGSSGSGLQPLGPAPGAAPPPPPPP